MPRSQFLIPCFWSFQRLLCCGLLLCLSSFSVVALATEKNTKNQTAAFPFFTPANPSTAATMGLGLDGSYALLRPPSLSDLKLLTPLSRLSASLASQEAQILSHLQLLDTLQVSAQTGFNWEGKEQSPIVQNLKLKQNNNAIVLTDNRTSTIYHGVSYFVGAIIQASFYDRFIFEFSYKFYTPFADDWNLDAGIVNDNSNIFKRERGYTVLALNLSYYF